MCEADTRQTIGSKLCRSSFWRANAELRLDVKWAAVSSLGLGHIQGHMDAPPVAKQVMVMSLIVIHGYGYEPPTQITIYNHVPRYE